MCVSVYVRIYVCITFRSSKLILFEDVITSQGKKSWRLYCNECKNTAGSVSDYFVRNLLYYVLVYSGKPTII